MPLASCSVLTGHAMDRRRPTALSTSVWRFGGFFLLFQRADSGMEVSPRPSIAALHYEELHFIFAPVFH